MVQNFPLERVLEGIRCVQPGPGAGRQVQVGSPDPAPRYVDTESNEFRLGFHNETVVPTGVFEGSKSDLTELFALKRGL